MMQDFGKFLMDGGIAVYGMILLSGFGIAVTAERIKALYFRYSIDTDGFVKKIRAMLISDKIEEAIGYCCSQKEALLPRVVKSVQERADRDDENIKNAQEIATMEIVPLVTQRLGYLAMIANVATLIGLLGTIHGLIQSFQAVSFADPAQKQTLLAQGISVSMNTTAMGLFVAIPVMIIYSFLQARQNKLIEEIVGGSAKVVDLLISRNYQTFDEETAFSVPGVLPKSNTASKRKIV